MVLSALTNSGGGVLIISLVTKAGDINLHKCQDEIVALLTHQENLIPGDMFTSNISCTKNETEKELLYLFVSKAAQLVTYYSNAIYMKQSNSEAIANNSVLMDMLGTCTCKNDTNCEEHRDLENKREIISVLSKMDSLTANQLFEVSESDCDTFFYRNYQLYDRSLPDVLSSQSVQNDILEMTSALANTNGGSIFLGVTNTATPTVVGYSLSEDDMKCTDKSIYDLLTGGNSGPVPIWGHPEIESTHYWKTFLHDVADDSGVRKVIEICIEHCPGGMFCALPVCLDIRHSGEIYQLDSFAKWKERLVHDATNSHNDLESDDYNNHFKREKVPVQVMPAPLSLQTAQKQTGVNQMSSSSTFCWWLFDNDIVAESLQFDHCCAKELADIEMNLSTEFDTFPPIEAITERHADVQRLDDSLNEILQEHQSHNGVAVFMENIPDVTLPIYAALKDATPEYHVIDLVILNEKLPPVIVSIFESECPREEATNYCLTLGKLLKRDCCTATHLGKGCLKLFFCCQLYFIGKGFVYLQDEGCYPKDYRCPSLQTIDTVRYALARILLDCQPYITNRYGNTMVRHLSSCQARILLGRSSNVLIVASKAGCGKTVLALEVARRIKKQNGNERKVAFFCPSRGLAAFVKWQTKGLGIFEHIQDWNARSVAEFNTHSFSQYTDVIIDDAHAIPVEGEPKTWQMYNALFSSLQKCNARAYIFLDSEMQDYRGCIPEKFLTQLRDLAEQHVKFNVIIEHLYKILRNSPRICQFCKACMGGSNMDGLSTIRQVPDDAVFFHNIQGRGINKYESKTLISQVEDILKKPAKYSEKDITILTDNQKDKTWVAEMLKGKYETSSATQFPVKHIVVDTLETFEGLESPVILFIIPQSWGRGYVGSLKYRLCVVTRAISRLEFLLPWDASDRPKDLEELKRAFPPVSVCCIQVLLVDTYST